LHKLKKQSVSIREVSKPKSDELWQTGVDPTHREGLPFVGHHVSIGSTKPGKDSSSDSADTSSLYNTYHAESVMASSAHKVKDGIDFNKGLSHKKRVRSTSPGPSLQLKVGSGSPFTKRTRESIAHDADLGCHELLNGHVRSNTPPAENELCGAIQDGLAASDTSSMSMDLSDDGILSDVIAPVRDRGIGDNGSQEGEQEEQENQESEEEQEEEEKEKEEDDDDGRYEVARILGHKELDGQVYKYHVK
jgi:hypothetical protein